MEYEELKKQSFLKILLRAKSGRGKTLNSSKIALNVAEAGGRVLFVDTEAEGSTTIVSLVEDEETRYEPEMVQNIEYVQVSEYDTLMSHIDNEGTSHQEFDLIIVDTLDHKHTLALREVTGAKREAGADWNEYPQIYSAEKQIMENLGKPRTNILATLDPESGKIDKPKGAQTNIHGYFNIVLELMKSDGENGPWTNRVRNFVGRGDLIEANVGISDLDENLTKKILERSEV